MLGFHFEFDNPDFSFLTCFVFNTPERDDLVDLAMRLPCDVSIEVFPSILMFSRGFKSKEVSDTLILFLEAGRTQAQRSPQKHSNQEA